MHLGNKIWHDLINMMNLDEIQFILKPKKLSYLLSVLIQHNSSILEHTSIECYDYIFN